VKEVEVKAEEKPANDKFEPDYSKFNLTLGASTRESDPMAIEKQPLVQIAKTIKALAKVSSIRLMTDKCIDALNFLEKIDQAVTDVSLTFERAKI